jgi:peptidoglycan hydrolase-like protein with peptidoglycan-binding domain
MGPLGLIRLADLTSCSAYGASATFAAAALGAAAEAWSASSKSSLYGPSAHPEWNLQNAAAGRARELSKTERRAMAVEKDALLRSDPIRLAKLEDEAALGRLQELGFAAAGADGLVFSGRATTTAVQYALEALGFIEFVNGPDNDYGPSTIEAAKRAQAAYGRPQTRWLAPEEVRELVCDAAVKKSDPVSYYHLTMMYAEGMGFRKDLARAKTSIARAEEILIARLEGKESLPAWKAREYPAFLARIQTLKSAIDDAYAALPAHAAAAGDASSRVCE